MLGACAPTYGALTIKMTVTPSGGGNASLIFLSTSSTPSITFAASNVRTDADLYKFVVEAGYGASFWTVPSSILASATANYTYLNPCLTSNMTWVTSPPVPSSAMSYLLSLTPANQTVSAIDLVSKINGIPNTCGAYNFTISDTPDSGVTALNSTELMIDSNGDISL
jgi:hypothetical protein